MGVNIDNFRPHENLATYTASSSSQNKSFTNPQSPTGSPLNAIRICNDTNGPVYVQWGAGAQTATTSSFYVPAGEDGVWGLNASDDNVAVIAPAAVGTVAISVGCGS